MLAVSLVLVLAGVPQAGGDGHQTTVAVASEAPQGARSSIDIFVFEAGAPVPDVEVRIGEQVLGKTDAIGGLSAQIPSGRRNLLLFRLEEKVVDLDLLTDDGELVQIIVTLRPGEKAQLDIENSGRSSVLAGERLAERAQEGAPETEAIKPPGALRGTIVSVEDKKPVVKARLFFSGTAVEAETDREGAFAIELPAGNYSVSVVHPDYATQTKDNIRVIPEREITLAIELTPAGLQLADYVVTAPYVEGSIASTIEAQRETSAVSEVLGAEQMAAAGDSDAAEALQRVSGLTIEQGKYVLVRGQNFRYTYTLWNGSPLPSPEPLLRVVPLDLFPTGVLSGIEVQKSFSPDRPAEFGGGLINLQTRGIPSEAFVSVTVNGGINSFSAFSEGLTYQGGGTDIFGFDDGTRAVPDAIETASNNGEVTVTPRNFSRDEVDALGRTFSNISNFDPQTLPPDFGVAIAGGGSIDIFGGGTFGVIGSAKWSTKWRRQRRIQRSFEVRTASNQLLVGSDFIEDRTDFNSDIGALLTLEADWGEHVVSANTFYAHQTQQRSQLDDGELIINTSDGQERRFELSWIDRTLIAQQLTGRHEFGRFMLEYRGVYSAAIRDAPDRREYFYRNPAGGEEIFFADDDFGLSRTFNEVEDALLSGGIDLTATVLDADKQWLGVQLKTGVAVSMQDRDVLNRSFQFQPDGADLTELDAEVLFDPANVGSNLEFIDQSDSRRDDSEGFIDVFGVFGMADIRLGDILRVVGGVRYEDASVWARTFNTRRGETARFRRKEYFPSVSATWFILEELQLRAAYAETTSRPNLNELSDTVFVNPDTGEELLGSPELVPALIAGAETRLEWYPTPTESVTLGLFWKGYDDPIEQVLRGQSGGSATIFTFENARRADVFGVEFGGRFEFSHVREWFDGPAFMDNIYVLGNVAILNSNLKVRQVGVDGRRERNLAGQADYTLNVQAGYSGDEHDFTIAYNLVGPRLFRAGEAFDVIRQEIGTLDITWTWRIWNDELTAGTLRIGASNLTDPDFEWTRGDFVWRSFTRGRTFGASFKIAFQ